jgi:hypothetical protein
MQRGTRHVKQATQVRRPAIAIIISIGALIIFLLFSEAPGSGSRTSPNPGSSKAKAPEGYFLRFAENFNPALASRDDLGISVVIAVDVSGSMQDPPTSGGGPKYLQAAAAFVEVERVIERLAAASPAGQVIKVGIIRFNEVVQPVLPLAALDEAGIAALRAIVNDPANFSPGGKTAIGGAVELGTEWLAQSGTILRSLVIITDGENTEGTEPATVLEAVYANRKSATKDDYPVSTATTLISFVGFDIGSGYFQSFAKLGARVTSAADRAELARALSSILEADITKLEAPSLGSPKAPGAPKVPGGAKP